MTTEHPIAHRNPKLILDLCFAADGDPITKADLLNYAIDVGYQQSTTTIERTIDELTALGALRLTRHFHKPTGTTTYRYQLTDLGRTWLGLHLPTPIPTIERTDNGYRWHHPTTDDTPTPTN